MHRLLLVAIISVFVFSQFCTAQEDWHILLIGISNYPEKSGWPQISSENDLALINSTLLKRGFLEENMLIIADEDATKKGILEAFADLTTRLKSGSKCIIHFSGHGQQIADRNNDEFDGWDEALVPYDSPLYFKEGEYHGENLLIDDEVRQLIQSLIAKVGKDGHILISLDACHSGTLTRGYCRSRGTAVKIAPQDVDVPPISNPDNQIDMVDFNFEENVVSISATSANELNYEYLHEDGKYYGPLSYALCKSIELLNLESSYANLFERIELEMAKIAPRQHPQMEGNDKLSMLLGHRSEDNGFYKIRWVHGQNINFGAGSLGGLFEGSEIGIYSSTSSQARLVAKGIIVRADLSQSWVLLDTILESMDLLECWAKVLRQQFGPLHATISYSDLSTNLKLLIDQDVDKVPALRIVQENADYNLTVENHQLRCYTRDDLLLFDYKEQSPSAISRGITKILVSMQVKYLRNLELSNENLDVQMRLEPLQLKHNHKLENGQFQIGDYYKLVLKNRSDNDVYFSIIDLMPNDSLHILLPENSSTRSDCMILAKTEIILQDSIEISKPVGTDILKLICSSRPLDLHKLDLTRGNAITDDPLNPFEELYLTTGIDYQLSTRSTAHPPPVPIECVNIFTMIIHIVDK